MPEKSKQAEHTGDADGPFREAAPGDEHEGLRVVSWMSQAQLAHHIQRTTRQVQNLEKRGLPNAGYAGTKEYPLPHVFIWWTQWRVQQVVDEKRRDGQRTERLPFAVALARHRLQVAEELAGIRGQ